MKAIKFIAVIIMFVIQAPFFIISQLCNYVVNGSLGIIKWLYPNILPDNE